MDVKDMTDAASKLTKATESLNSTLQAIQDKINAAKPGIEVWLDKEIASKVFLGYARTGVGWGLAIKYSDMGKPEPLLSAPRAIRIAALPLLQDVINAITDKTEDVAVTIEQAQLQLSIK